LVATILSAQCTDVRVNEVTKSLFQKYPTPVDFAQAALAELERDIQPTGFFRNKAKNVQGCCRMLLERFDGRVPNTMEQLLELPGVGRKTANVILGVLYGIAVGVVVDTHVDRLSHRLGLSKEKTPEKIERDLMALFPQNKWIMLSHRLIFHGRRCCTARKPQCDVCPLESLCPKIGVVAKKS
jgi:endonuclease-3